MCEVKYESRFDLMSGAAEQFVQRNFADRANGVRSRQWPAKIGLCRIYKQSNGHTKYWKDHF